MILARVKTVHKFAEDMKATRLKDERRKHSKHLTTIVSGGGMRRY
jgi:hypothetical protein